MAENQAEALVTEETEETEDVEEVVDMKEAKEAVDMDEAMEMVEMVEIAQMDETLAKAGSPASPANAADMPGELELLRFAVDVYAKMDLPSSLLKAADLSTKENILNAASIMRDALRQAQPPASPSASYDRAAAPAGYTPRAAGVDELRGIRAALGLIN